MLGASPSHADPRHAVEREEGPLILVRTVFRAKFGKGGELAKRMVENMRGTDPASRWLVLTDLSSGPFDTVVLEARAESLAAWEQIRAQMFADPSVQEARAPAAGLIESGHAELYTVEGEGGQ